MTIREYAEMVSDEVAKRTGKTVEVREVNKANQELTAVVVIDGNVGMNYYVDDPFERGIAVDECAVSVIETYEDTSIPDFDAENMDFRFESVKDKILPRLIDIQKNKNFLEEALYKDVGCGLALISDIVEGDYRMTIRKDMAEANGYDNDEVFLSAMKNSEEKQGVRLSSMMGAIIGMGGNVYYDDSSLDEDMYVLTNDENFMGAPVIFFDGVLERIREKFGCGFYILPSSIHEVILVPERTEKIAEDLKKIVLEANKSVVDPKEVLSDNVYYYEKKLEIAA